MSTGLCTKVMALTMPFVFYISDTLTPGASLALERQLPLQERLPLQPIPRDTKQLICVCFSNTYEPIQSPLPSLRLSIRLPHSTHPGSGTRKEGQALPPRLAEIIRSSQWQTSCPCLPFLPAKSTVKALAHSSSLRLCLLTKSEVSQFGSGRHAMPLFWDTMSNKESFY